MRIAFAAPRPSRVASATNRVVENGMGGRRRVSSSANSRTIPSVAPSTRAEDRFGLGPVRPGPVLVLEQELDPLVRAGGPKFPVGRRHELLDRLIALDQQRQGRGLHTSDGEEAAATLAGREGQVPGQERPPDQVDLLARLGGLRQRVVELLEVGEALLDDPRVSAL